MTGSLSAVILGICFAIVVLVHVRHSRKKQREIDHLETRLSNRVMGEVKLFSDLEHKIASLTTKLAGEKRASDEFASLFQKSTETMDKLKIDHSKELKEGRKDAIVKSKAVTRGHTAETFIPFGPEFSYDPRDCRFFGAPIDYIIFDGMSSGSCKRLVFVEVKTGTSKKTKRQNQIKRAIEDGKVEFHTIHLLDNVEEITE